MSSQQLRQQMAPQLELHKDPVLSVQLPVYKYPYLALEMTCRLLGSVCSALGLGAGLPWPASLWLGPADLGPQAGGSLPRAVAS